MQIYLTNLGKYNEGELVGEWMTIPFTDSELEGVLENIGIDGEEYEEYFITDYEAPFAIDEYESLDTVNEWAENAQAIIDAFNGDDEVAEAYIYNYGVDANANDIFIVYAEESNIDLAYTVVDEIDGGVENLTKETLENYFDYESYGRDLAFEFTYLGNGIWVHDI